MRNARNNRVAVDRVVIPDEIWPTTKESREIRAQFETMKYKTPLQLIKFIGRLSHYLSGKRFARYVRFFFSLRAAVVALSKQLVAHTHAYFAMQSARRSAPAEACLTERAIIVLRT